MWRRIYCFFAKYFETKRGRAAIVAASHFNLVVWDGLLPTVLVACLVLLNQTGQWLITHQSPVKNGMERWAAAALMFTSRHDDGASKHLVWPSELSGANHLTIIIRAMVSEWVLNDHWCDGEFGCFRPERWYRCMHVSFRWLVWSGLVGYRVWACLDLKFHP
jgi:hypothetical protein